jgi:uncharacterized protein YecT (DUF1311 family)
MRLLITLLTGSFLLSASVSFGASFDCKKASTEFEHLICDNAELNKLDEDLGKAYKQKRDSLSKDGKDLLKKSQRNWLKFVRENCDLNGKSNVASIKNKVLCVNELYEDRIELLSREGTIRKESLFCTAEDKQYNDSIGAVDPDEAYKFSLKIKEAFGNKDLVALYNLVDGDPVYGPRRAYALSKKFDELFPQESIDNVLKYDIDCRTTMDKPFNLDGIFFHLYPDSLGIYSITNANDEPTLESKPWVIDGAILSADCFEYEWMSSDNFEEYEERYNIDNVNYFRESPGEFFGREIKDFREFEASYGSMIGLVKPVGSCKAEADYFVEDEYGDFPYFLQKSVAPEECTKLAPNLGINSQECFVVEQKRRQATVGVGIYGIFDLPRLGKSVVPLKLFWSLNAALNFLE